MLLRTKRTTTLAIAMVFLSFLMSACGGEPTIDINMQKTSFAQTADVQASLTAQAQPTATQTSTPTATFTSTPEVTPTPTATDSDSELGSAVTPQINLGGSDVARWMGNNPPDNTKIAPGKTFTVTWTLENIGTSTWTTNYYIQFASGEQMGAKEKVFLPYPVANGTNVKVSVDFTAPSSTGEKRSNWKLYNANDVAFYDFYIIINVSSQEAPEQPAAATPTITQTVIVTPTATTEESP